MMKWKWFKKVALLLTVGIWGNASSVNAQQVSVAADGSGEFRTIQAAIASLPDHADRPRIILIRKGTYREQLFIDGKNHITLRGESEKGTVVTFALARDAARCAGNTDDWGVATVNLRNAPDITLENLTVVNSYGFEAAGDQTLPCPSDPRGQKVVSKTGHQMALRTFAGTTRLMVRRCTFRALGGDTVSPWDTEGGMYYFKDCTMEGGVDFYCPRGWAYAENVRFICHNRSAAIWHDGSGHRDSKTVLKNCSFEGEDQFKLGRYHRESQFYLVGCRFPRNMADADIYHAPSGPGTPAWGRRVYYAKARRKGGNFAWMQDNLASAEGAPQARQITAAWTFGGRWNPEAPAGTPLARVAVALDSVAEHMLVFQRAIGGWPKAVGEVKVNYEQPLSRAQRAATRADAGRRDATIDNNATTREIRYLTEAFKRTSNPAYRQAAERGVRYLLQMQLKSGGFPQFYPDSSGYRGQITYNDDAMVRALQVLREVAGKQGDFALLDHTLVEPAKQAVARGVQCMLRTQYVQRGRLTAWGAQHDRRTLLPCKARAFELPSLSGMETVGIVRFLMGVENPGPEVRAAIAAAVAWLEAVKMPGYAIKEIQDPSQPTGRDRIVVAEAGATLWARFYDLDTNQPIYVGRAGEKKAALADIENERRAGYAYAGTWPAKLLATEYPKWQKKWENGKSGL
ncbi:pectate lyase [Hymenobacter sp. B81]|uniref:pectate lyase n=1 Tax=Hymenobacter sp. B81 TaxID=3344878 RepID=UPI0037DD5B71